MAEAARKSRELATSILTRAGLRPTRQRLLLAQVLFGRGDRHVTAEQLHSEAEAEGATISLATVYNTLHQFLAAGQVREVVIEAGRAYFDTNVTDHHHLYNEGTGQLRDISQSIHHDFWCIDIWLSYVEVIDSFACFFRGFSIRHQFSNR